MDGSEFDRILSPGPSEDDRVAAYGAVLAREFGLQHRLIIMGEAAIKI